ncbi:hypothetical protein ACSE3M_02675 [Bacillus velezensis]
MFLKGSGVAFYLRVLSPLNEFIEYLDDVEDRFEKSKMRYENEAKELSRKLKKIIGIIILMNTMTSIAHILQF